MAADSPRAGATRGRRRRGVMLILTLWLVVILSIMTVSLISHLMLQTRLNSLRKQTFEADAIARAGIAKAVADLKNDLIQDNSNLPDRGVFDSEGDVWKRPEEGKEDEEVGRGTFTVEVNDQEALLNINTASPQVIAALLQVLGYEEADALEAAGAIVDWRDADDSPSVPRAVAGAKEADIYGVMVAGGDPTQEIREPQPIRIKNEAFFSRDELLWVYGVTPELYFGPDSPEAAAVPVPEWAGKKFSLKNPGTSSKDDRPIGLRDCITVNSNGTLNVNTARREPLMALLRVSGIDIASVENVADRIIDYRRGGRTKDIDEKNAFRRLDDLSKVSEVGGRVSQMASNYPLSVSSQNFLISSTGMTKGARASKTLRVLCVRNIEYYSRSESFEDMERERDRREYPLMPGSRSDMDQLRSKDLGPDERTVILPAVRVVRWLDD